MFAAAQLLVFLCPVKTDLLEAWSFKLTSGLFTCVLNRLKFVE